MRGPLNMPAIFSSIPHMTSRIARDLSRRWQSTALLRGGQTESYDATATCTRALSSGGAQQPRGDSEAQGAGGLSSKSNAATLQGFSAVPGMPKFLGLAGAIPFLALAPPIAAGIPLMPVDIVASAATLQVGYGASIASFLGGIHWALAMANHGQLSGQANNDRYLWSVTPSLMAWPAVMLQPGPGALIVASTLGVVYFVDRSFAHRGLLPRWYMALRLPLTLAAIGGLSVTCVQSLRSMALPRVEAVPPSDEAESETR